MSSLYTRPHDWNPPSRVESRFFDLGEASDPRLSSESLEPSPRYPSATRGRMVFARALGVVGILATVPLAVLALRSRMTAGLGRIFDDVRLPWDPSLNPGPAPSVLDWSREAAPLAVKFEMAPAIPATAVAPMEPITAPDPTAPTSIAEPEPAPTSIAAPKPVAPFTPEEIQRRKDRYEQWLREQRLERIP